MTSGIVIYTDGSARPNPGYTGSGLHGYRYVPAEKFSKAGKWLITDKGYLSEKEVEYLEAKPVSPVIYFDAYRPSLQQGTNNQAEILAPCILFEYFHEHVVESKSLHIVSDSKLMIEGITKWVDNWRANNWMTGSGSPVKNQDEWERLDFYIRRFKEENEVSFRWVLGHDEDYGNTKADFLASIATAVSTRQSDAAYIQTSEPQGYHKTDVEIHDLLSLKRIYFNSDREYNAPGIYYQTGWAGNEFIVGKRVGDSYFSVVQLKTPDPLIEKIFDHQAESNQGDNSVMYLKLDRLRNPFVYQYLREHGTHVLNRDRRNLNLNFLDGKPVTFEVRPGELPLRAIDILANLEELLEKFNQGHLKPGMSPLGVERIQITDITDHFYEKVEKKKGKEVVMVTNLKKEFVPGMLHTEISFEAETAQGMREFKRKLLFNEDLPNRNVLKRIETEVPALYLLSWQESDNSLRYSVVVHTETATAIWSSHFSNLVYF
jgi:ribonuclease HI